MQEATRPQPEPGTHHALKERVALVSILASAAITVGKGAAGYATGSLALISDAAHSLVDVAATTLTFLAIRAAHKPADEEHPFGHGKFESLAALVETAFLFILSGAVAFEGLRRLVSGETEVTPNRWAVAVLVAAIVIDAWRWWVLTRTARKTGSEALAADALHFSSDLVNSVLVLAALGAAAYGYPQADALVAVGVSVFIAVAGFRLAGRTLGSLLDAAPKGMAGQARTAIAAAPGVVGVDEVRLRQAGGSIMGEATVAVSRTLPQEDVLAIKERVAEAFAGIAPGSRLTVTTRPVAVDDETILERVMLIAARRRLAVHHITIQTVGGRLSISADIEIDGRTSLGEAHAVADAFEGALRDEFGHRTEVETHLEPLEVTRLEGREAEATLVARIATAIADHARAGGTVSDVHSVRVRATEAGLVVNYHCRMPPTMSVDEAHRCVDEVDRKTRLALPEIVRIVGHAEPIRS